MLGQIEVTFLLGEDRFPFKACVVDNSMYQVILGRDFLQFFKAKIDLDRGILNMEPCKAYRHVQSHSEDGPSPTSSCSVYCPRSCILPPRTESIVPARIRDRSWVGFAGTFEPSVGLSDRYELYGAAALVVVTEHGTIPVRIMNPTAKSIRLFRYSTLGTLEAEDKEIMAVDLEETGYPPENPPAGGEDLKDAIDLTEADLTTDQRQRLLVLLGSYRDVFALTPKELGRTSEVMHVIDTGDARPFRLRAYRTSPIHRQEIDKQIDEMLDQGIVQPSVSPWSSPVVLVKKKDGSIRFCVDYRKLNSVTKKDSYPLPRIDETLEAMQGARIFSTLDLRSGYWQTKIHPDSVEKTAFQSHHGLFEFVVLPFGLCNSPRRVARHGAPGSLPSIRHQKDQYHGVSPTN